MEPSHRVVIIGGGFGGLHAAQALRRERAQVTLVDRRNFHLFQPLLYQVALGGLSPANIAAPLRGLLRNARNTKVLLAEARAIDVVNRRVELHNAVLEYDTLIVAAGARHHYFGHPEWENLAPGLKTIEDATEIRRRVLLAFEAAESEADPKRRDALLTFVIVGAGPTGVELAGAVAELARHTLRGNFRVIDPAKAQILLVEGTDRVLPPYPPDLSAKAARALERLGVVVRTGMTVTDIHPEYVILKQGERSEHIPAHTVLWAAGVDASPLGRMLAQATGATLDRAGRIQVEADCSLPGHKEIFVIGDMANYRGADGRPLPGVAPVAMQQGDFVARVIGARLRKDEPPTTFRYRDYGSMATIGRNAAVADFGKIRFNGYLAWLAWLFIHVLKLIEFENRILVMTQWAWNYFTRNRSARLITGEARIPPVPAAPPLQDRPAS